MSERRAPHRAVILRYRPTAGMLRLLNGEKPVTEWDLIRCRMRGLLRDDATETEFGTAVILSEARRLEIAASGSGPQARPSGQRGNRHG